MSGKHSTQILTANRLIEGDVVYWTKDGTWSPHFSAAHVFAEPVAAQAALALAEGQHGRVVGCYLAPVLSGPNGPETAHFREAFRRRGPSNYQHGKQAHARG